MRYIKSVLLLLLLSLLFPARPTQPQIHKLRKAPEVICGGADEDILAFLEEVLVQNDGGVEPGVRHHVRECFADSTREVCVHHAVSDAGIIVHVG